LIARLFRKPERSLATQLYTGVVEAGRQPRFYAAWGVEDSLDGRFDMVVLHLCLLLRRLDGAGPVAAQRQMELIEVFIEDMDLTVRELGAGDLGVGKRVKSMADALNGRRNAYTNALNSGDLPALEAALTRNVYRERGTIGVEQLAAYVVAQADNLARQPIEPIIAGQSPNWSAA
jgi:cytochrome b pre-mRNA-processing protein 3